MTRSWRRHVNKELMITFVFVFSLACMVSCIRSYKDASLKLNSLKAVNETRFQWVRQNTEWYRQAANESWLGFDRVYFISMPKRLEHVKQTAAALGINNPWILKAFNKDYLNISYLYEQHFVTNDFLSRDRKGRSAAGELGCAISHIAVALHCMHDPSVNTCVIFEDDLQLSSENSISRMKSFLDQVAYAKLRWDVLYLGYGAEPQTNEGSKEYIKLKNPTGLYAYVLNKKSIKKLLVSVFPINIPIDTNYGKQILQKNILAFGPRHERFFSVDATLGSNIRDTVVIYDQYLPCINKRC
jgi:GR25 family glycosyltransferase involved in LPS biosynthesis